MKTRTLLTDRFFTVAALFVLLTTLAGSRLDVLVLLAFLGTGYAAFVMMDRSSLGADEALALRFDGKDAYDLGTQAEFAFGFTSNVWEPDALELHPPELSLVTLGERAATYVASQGTGLTGSFTFAGPAVRLGEEKIEQVRLSRTSRFGFWRRLMSAPCEDAILRVVPSRLSMPDDALHRAIAEQPVLIEGSRRLSRGSVPEQFHTVRPFRYPDSLRHLDHKKTAKLGQPMTRIYDSLNTQHVTVCIDVGRAMCGTISGNEKVSFAYRIAAGLIGHALRLRDSAELIVFCRSILFSLGPTRRPGDVASLRALDGRLAARDEWSDFSALARTLSTRSSSKHLVFIFTDQSYPSVQDAILANLGPVFQRHLTAVVGIRDKQYAPGPALDIAGGSNSGEQEYYPALYRVWLEDEAQKFVRRIAGKGGASVMLPEEYAADGVRRIYESLRWSYRV